MNFSVVVVEDHNSLTQHNLDEFVCYKSSLPDGIVVVMKQQHVTSVAKRLSEKYPNRDVFVLEQKEAFFSQSNPVIRKLYDPKTGEFVVTE